MSFSQPVTERPHGFHARTRAVDQHDRDGNRVARTDIEHIEHRTGDLHPAAPCGITALDDKDSGLCDPGKEQ